ncbi:probable magnesium transporter NIPA1 isoform X2 [Lactuca sativa]|uniref:probable magnesium transporter NIPA1 isoform X2 n=1 Tax=Lactuca sativa TaxID=4236 RepID=UPI001C68C94D|nr:probable magnesium transporter NIPA1 isoform X2 [Lactuca sativa]
MGGMSSDNIHGLVLAISSSLFIGSSFIIKKKGLMKAGATGIRAGEGGYTYLKEPWWWAGMVSMIIGEVANFAAYAYAPAILVTPLGALSMIIRLHIFGVVGCALCLVGSTVIVLHAPQETQVDSVKQVWFFATEPRFLVYAFLVLVFVGVLIYRYVPLYGGTHLVIYVGICSLMGSLTVMCVKAVGIAMKLSFSGSNQFIYFQTWIFTLLLFVFCLTQLNYLNKALDTFNTAVISPVYYVMFTSLTILASMIMFKNWNHQNATQIVTELSGFVTIFSGTFLLHKTKDMGTPVVVESPKLSHSVTRSTNESPRRPEV